MNCPQCGGNVLDGVAYCPSCGAKLFAQSAQPAEPAQPAAQPYMPEQPEPQPYMADSQYAQPAQPAPQAYVPEQPQYAQPAPVAQAQDKGSIGWGILGFLIPIVGLILFLVWRNTKPNSAKVAGIGAIIGFVVNLIITFATGM